MDYAFLRRILDAEGQSFRIIKNDWRPTDLLADYQTKLLLADIIRRRTQVQAAQDELKTLDRAALYTRLSKRMGIRVREAIYARRLDQLTFLLSVAKFYEDFGTMLRYLRFDRMRGILDPPTTGV